MPLDSHVKGNVVLVGEQRYAEQAIWGVGRRCRFLWQFDSLGWGRAKQGVTDWQILVPDSTRHTFHSWYKLLFDKKLKNFQICPGGDLISPQTSNYHRMRPPPLELPANLFWTTHFLNTVIVWGERFLSCLRNLCELYINFAIKHHVGHVRPHQWSHLWPLHQFGHQASLPRPIICWCLLYLHYFSWRKKYLLYIPSKSNCLLQHFYIFFLP